jgi:uncharacterized protein YegL
MALTQKFPSPPAAVRGLSLIEIAILLLFTSLALLPLMQNMGGRTSTNSANTLAQETRFRTKETIVANALIEKALAGQIIQSYSGSGTPSVFDTLNTTNMPPGGVVTLPRSQYYDSALGARQQVWFDWVLRDMSYKMTSTGALQLKNGQPDPALPTNNQVILATLRLYTSNAVGEAPSLVMPTYLFRNVSTTQTPTSATTSIVLVGDTSGSMIAGLVERCNAPNTQLCMPTISTSWDNYSSTNTSLSAPFLRYSQTAATLYDDRSLDLTWSEKDDRPDTETQYDDTFLPGKSPAQALDGPCSLPNVANWPAAYRAKFSTRFLGMEGSLSKPIWLAATSTIGSMTPRQVVAEYCKAFHKQPENRANFLNTYMPRIEAMRNGFLSFLYVLEANQALASTTKLGFVSFSTNVTIQQALEKTSLVEDPANGNLKRPRFKNVRPQLLRINRDNAPGGLIPPDGGTFMEGALKTAYDQLAADQESNNKIVLLLTDGLPNGGKSGDELVNYVAGLYKPQKITLYAIGVIGADNVLMDKMAKKVGNNSQYFPVTDISQLQQIFEQIAYNVERTGMQNMMQRHRLNMK